MIDLRHVAVRFPGKEVLADVSLQVGRGGLVCLFGPSGIGKSTILDVVAGLRHPRHGSRTVDTQRIGYAFQEPRLLPWRSVFQNVRIALSGWLSEAEASSQATAWLRRFGLGDAMDRLPAELSGGMRRRANLARAFAAAPELLLLDEPFAFLDGQACSVLADAIREQHRAGVTVLMVAHVMEQIGRASCRERV